jgi:plasmid maintenance system antidote protein VapI
MMKKKLSRTEVAKALGISVGHTSDILRGRRQISKRLAIKISEVAGLPLDFSLTKPPADVFSAALAAASRK